MPRKIIEIILTAFAISVGAVAADAADLPAQSRLGAIFVERVGERGVVYRPVEEAPIIPFNLLPNPPWNRGTYNYGSSWDFYYPGPYYGGPYAGDGPRLPYVCGFYGYC